MFDADDIHFRTARNRRFIADVFDGLAREQLAVQSLCPAWSVREVLAHLVMPFTVTMPQMLRAALRYRSMDGASAQIARQLAHRDVRELTGLLRDNADRRFMPPGVGPMGQFVDGAVHLRDCARPLGLDADVPEEDWALIVDWLVTKQARLGHMPKGLLDGLRFEATDREWAHGDGPVVRSALEPLGMAMTGRAVALADLTGPGVETLRSRLG